ncbi:UNVERIFIED_CONTAM: hypothetical protein RMT77_008662 [Armadillidium vulgare]
MKICALFFAVLLILNISFIRVNGWGKFSPNVPVKSGCFAIGPWAGNYQKDQWCRKSCAIGNCPINFCKCNPKKYTKEYR